MWLISTELKTLATKLIVKAHPLRVHSTMVGADRIYITMSMASVGARCPCCHRVSRRVHSRYQRTPTDLPWGGMVTRVVLHVRRFHCDTPSCEQQIFAEQVTAFLGRYARRTESLEQQLLQLVWSVGGEVGANLARQLQISISADTLLRLIRRRAQSKHDPAIRILGVDDWAFRKGRRYGTILCDLERGEVIDLLPDREAQTFADWLVAHPGIEIISRDRGGAYAEGAHQGAPDALQVADRFHLLMNLADAVKRVMEHEHAVIRQCIVERAIVPDPEPEPAITALIPAATQKNRQFDLTAQARDDRYRTRYDTAHRLHKDGVSKREISRQMGLARNTIAKLLNAPTYPGIPARHHAESLALAPFHDYLAQRWQEGIQNIQQLQREIRERGFLGAYSTLWTYLQPWKRTQPQSPKHAAPKRVPIPTPSQAAWAILTPPDQRNAVQIQQVAAWCSASDEIAKTQTLALSFGSLVRSRAADQLDNWLSEAQASQIKIWQRFAAGLQGDYEAVANALKLSWSNGMVEGFVQRLKLIKRQAYGRANLDLLKARIIRLA